MFDINEALDKIIFKYQLDKHYPVYRNMRDGESILKDMLLLLCKNNVKTLCVCSDQLEIDIIKHITHGSKLVDCIVFKHKEQEEFENTDWYEYKKIFIISYEKYDVVAGTLKSKDISFEWIYDIFKEKGICFNNDFYKFNPENMDDWFNDSFPGKEGWRNNIQLELYFCQKEYKNAIDLQEKYLALEKCLFLALYLRNFILSNQYFKLLEKKEDKYKQAYNEVENLLKEIKEKVKSNREKNIVVYWLDAISYKDCEDMSYLNQQMSKSVVFENAFTSTPNTFPTAKNMFLGKRMVDDRAYKIKTLEGQDSALIRFLDENGYEIKIISGYMRWFDYGKQSYKRHELYAPCSVVMWDLLQNLMNQSKKTFYIVHSLVEGHHPFLSSRMTEESIKDDTIRFVLGRQELDEQLGFYDNFLCDEAYRIYMSDHGHHDFATRYHVIFAIYNKYIESKRIKGLFSLLDFSKVIEQMVEKNEIDEEEFGREYVEIQGIDWYNPKLIATLIKEKRIPDLHFMGYKGLITEKEIYIKFKTGHEWYAERENIIYEPVAWNCINNIYNKTKLVELRRIVGEYPADIDADERFKYSKYIYKLFDKYNQYMEFYMTVICEELHKYSEKSVAIRMGGNHSAELYAKLPEEYKEKIVCFIDGNKKCVCEKYGLPILSLQEINDEHIQAIVLSSFEHLEELREEAKIYPGGMDIVDIYKALEKKGIYCNNNFYMDIKMRDEDYDVGFPFEELN